EVLGDTGVAVLPVPVKNLHGCDLDLVETIFLRHRPKLLVLCSTLSNPSGATIPNSNRLAILEICRRTGTRILEDDIYGELTERDNLRPLRSFDDGSTVSYVTSFSKTVSAGIRVGVCIPGGNTDAFALLKSQQDMHSSTLCEIGFRKYLQESDFDEHLRRVKQFNRCRREIASGVIEQHFPPGTKIWRPEGGFMLWVEVGVELEDVYRRCLAQNVAFGRGSAFYTQPGDGARAMRLNCSRPPLDRLVAGIEILGKILAATT
ncbi:MAG: PLP-dependent aminotransferase family protein, partial [Verrucomicrobia bacterium]|nr:PLP-dependent aminotransferase family protein [Verrucomicrobiota bacterium]